MSQKNDDVDFDCIAFKRRVQAEIYEQIKDLSVDGEIAYFRRRVEGGPFAELWRKISPAGAETLSQ